MKNLARDVESIALALSEEGGYEYYHIDDDLRELAKDVSDMQAENAKLRELVSNCHGWLAVNCEKGYVIPRNGLDAIEQSMRELGVEVE